MPPQDVFGVALLSLDGLTISLDKILGTIRVAATRCDADAHKSWLNFTTIALRIIRITNKEICREEEEHHFCA